jgi:hypothetical protein
VLPFFLLYKAVFCFPGFPGFEEFWSADKRGSHCIVALRTNKLSSSFVYAKSGAGPGCFLDFFLIPSFAA